MKEEKGKLSELTNAIFSFKSDNSILMVTCLQIQHSCKM